MSLQLLSCLFSAVAFCVHIVQHVQKHTNDNHQNRDDGVQKVFVVGFVLGLHMIMFIKLVQLKCKLLAKANFNLVICD